MTDIFQRQKDIALKKAEAQKAKQVAQGTQTVRTVEKASDLDYQNAVKDFETKYIKLDNGEYIERTAFDKLDTYAKNLIKTKGVDSYNQYKTQQAEAEFAKSNVKLADGSWITKESYDALPLDWQGELYRRGNEGYQKWWDSKPYGSSTTFYVMDGRVYIPSETANIGIDSTGMRVYLGDRWTEQAIRYSGKPTDINAAQMIAQGIAFTPAEVTLPSLYRQPTENEKTYGQSFLAEHTQLGNGEWIATSTLGNLDSKTRESLIKSGSSASIDTSRPEANYAIKQIKEATQYANEIKSNPNYIYEQDAIKLKSGELIDATAYKNISSDLKVALDKGGFKEYEKILATDYIKLPDDSYITKKEYNDLTFTQKEIANTKGIQGLQELEQTGQSVINTLNRDYKTGDNYNIAKYLSDTKDIQGLVAAGFANKDINDAVKSTIKPIVTTKEVNQTIKVINDVWQFLTPWAEDKDETFITYLIKTWEEVGQQVKNVPQNIKIMAGNKEELDKYKKSEGYKTEQSKLKDVYTQEQNSPWWWDAIFGKTVLKQPDGSYSMLVQGMADFGSPIGSGAGRAAELQKIVKQMKPYIQVATQDVAKETGMAVSQYKRFLQFRVYNPETRLTPQQWKNWDDIASRGILTVKNKLPENISQPNIQKRAIKSTGSHLSGKHGQSAINKQLSEYTEKLLIEKGLKKPSVVEQIAKIPEKDLTKEQALVKQAQEIYDKANESVKQVIESTSYGTASVAQVDKALLNVVSTGSTNAAVLLNSQAMTTALAKASPEVRNVVLKNLDTETATQLKLGNSAKAESMAKLQQQEQIKIQQIALQISNLAENLLNEGKTVAEVKSKVQQFAKAQTQAIPNTQTKAEVQAIIKPIIQNITEPILNPVAKVQPSFKTLTTPIKITTTNKTPKKGTQPKTPKQKEKDKDKPKKKIPPPIFILKPREHYDKLNREQKKGIVAWKQGFDFILKYPPYEKLNTIHSRKPLAGVKYYDGVGSAAKSIVAKYGNIPPLLADEMGIMSFTITSTKGKRQPKLKFATKPNIPRKSGTYSSIKTVRAE